MQTPRPSSFDKGHNGTPKSTPNSSESDSHVAANGDPTRDSQRDLHHGTSHCGAVSVRQHGDGANSISFRQERPKDELRLALAADDWDRALHVVLSGAHHFWMAYIALIVAGMGMCAPNATFLAIVPEMLPRNVAGEAMAFINACGALGGFVGAWSVGYLEAVTGGSRAGFLAMSIALMAAGTIMLSLRNCDSVYKPAG